MAANEFVDLAYKTGAGRYIQEDAALDMLGTEVARLGNRAFIVAGPNGARVAGPRAHASLEGAGVPYAEQVRDCPTSFEAASELAELARAAGSDVIVAMGGGRIMDLGKAVAASGGWPIVQVPTSIATCAAFTPLSVMYNPDGSFKGTWRYEREVDAVIVDMQVMATQPARLIASGVLDAIAKVPELAHGTDGLSADDEPAGRWCAYQYALANNRLLEQFTPAACEEAESGKPGAALERVVFLNVALTGIVSALTRGFHQTALAHKFYDGMRTLFPKRAGDYLHGELVAIGLIMQLSYNGQPDEALRTAAFMRSLGMATSLPELGIARDDEGVAALRDYIDDGEFIGADEASQVRYAQAFETLFGMKADAEN
jgi:glycerol dehydrogenase-like iron-containing ADH family enzyme